MESLQLIVCVIVCVIVRGLPACLRVPVWLLVGIPPPAGFRDGCASRTPHFNAVAGTRTGLRTGNLVCPQAGRIVPPRVDSQRRISAFRSFLRAVKSVGSHRKPVLSAVAGAAYAGAVAADNRFIPGSQKWMPLLSRY